MDFSNRLSRSVAKLNSYPDWMKYKMLSFLIGKTVKYVGTSGVRFEEMTSGKVVVSLHNVNRVRNHIGQIHAAAMVLLAETATGMVVGMNVPDTSVPVIKTIKTDFKKRTQGAMRAVATLTPEQVELIRNTEKGETPVEVHVTDETGGEPILCEMLWAWVPKKRPANPA